MRGVASRDDDLDWRAIARAEVQPQPIAILEVMLGGPPEGDAGWATKAVAEALGVPIENVSYHVRTLAARGLIERVGERHVRGARQVFYRLACRAP
jgi:DNA-binding MarR family transcriptional regulator